ncbi:MAG: hypothetical protein GF311_28165 [Candidatus Lokiarchaeota archaeon]|nr:hypothetical protein [Candidatus Lokiarchaeota archaeon]
MKIKPNKEEMNFLLKFQAFSGLNNKDAIKFFKALMKIVYMDYVENEETVIPFLGSMALEYLGDYEENGALVENIKINLVLNKYLSKSIGQYEDGDVSLIEKEMEWQIKKELKQG